MSGPRFSKTHDLLPWMFSKDMTSRMTEHVSAEEGDDTESMYSPSSMTRACYEFPHICRVRGGDQLFVDERTGGKRSGL